MAFFGFVRAGATGSAAAGARCIMVVTPAANRRCKIGEFSLNGNGGTSAAAAYMEGIIVVTTGAGATTTTSIAATKLDPDSAAFASAVSHTFVTTPSDPTFTAATGAAVLGMNNYGGVYRWTARPNGEIITRNVGGSIGAAGSIMLYNNNSFTNTYSAHTIIDEI